VFTSAAPVAPATRARILAAAQAVGYAPPTVRPGVAPTRGATVGLLMGALQNPFYHTLMAAFLDRLGRRGLRVLCQAAEDADAADAGVRALLDQGAEALIAASLSLGAGAVGDCLRAGAPLILVNRVAPDEGVASVQTDNLAGGRAAADFLAHAGHRRCAFIGGLESSSTNRDRLAGFCDRLAERGLPEPAVEGGVFTYDFGREAAKRLILSPQRPEALFCANDVLAFGALDALRCDLGLRVPQDVSVIGFDDVPMAAWPSFDLTTIRQRRSMMVDATMERLEAALSGARHPAPHVAIEGRLIVRGSARFSPG
jgi:DNA-binding LacI/PurR family transcriptional regulator